MHAETIDEITICPRPEHTLHSERAGRLDGQRSREPFERPSAHRGIGECPTNRIPMKARMRVGTRGDLGMRVVIVGHVRPNGKITLVGRMFPYTGQAPGRQNRKLCPGDVPTRRGCFEWAF